MATEADLLEEIYSEALEIHDSGEEDLTLALLTSDERINIETILEYQEKRKAVLTVLTTLLLKKVDTPTQNIRLHQDRFPDGFSGRTLDTRVVTPFLRGQKFPHMSESGWLTRSLEQPYPYDLNYQGRIQPQELKDAFLQLIDSVERQGESTADSILIALFLGLIESRDKSTNLVLDRPVNLSVSEVVAYLKAHHSVNSEGASRLPVLSMHAILCILSKELERYRDCEVLPLEKHTAADARLNLIGDVNVLNANSSLYEGYEVKHNIQITSGLIETAFEKLRTTQVERYYILTTYPHTDYSEFQADIRKVAQTHGCQLIVNGVDQTLAYYLRLIDNTKEFINEYVNRLETDSVINFYLKESWNRIVQGQN